MTVEPELDCARARARSSIRYLGRGESAYVSQRRPSEGENSTYRDRSASTERAFSNGHHPRHTLRCRGARDGFTHLVSDTRGVNPALLGLAPPPERGERSPQRRRKEGSKKDLTLRRAHTKTRPVIENLIDTNCHHRPRGYGVRL